MKGIRLLAGFSLVGCMLALASCSPSNDTKLNKGKKVSEINTYTSEGTEIKLNNTMEAKDVIKTLNSAGLNNLVMRSGYTAKSLSTYEERGIENIHYEEILNIYEYGDDTLLYDMKLDTTKKTFNEGCYSNIEFLSDDMVNLEFAYYSTRTENDKYYMNENNISSYGVNKLIGNKYRFPNLYGYDNFQNTYGITEFIGLSDEGLEFYDLSYELTDKYIILNINCNLNSYEMDMYFDFGIMPTNSGSYINKTFYLGYSDKGIDKEISYFKYDKKDVRGQNIAIAKVEVTKCNFSNSQKEKAKEKIVKNAQ